MTTPFSDLLVDARNGLPGVTDLSLTNALRRAAIKLCVQSQVWIDDHDPVTLQQGVIDYDFEPPDGARVERIVDAKLDGRDIGVARFRDMAHATTHPARFTHYIGMKPVSGSFRVWPVPDADAAGSTITMQVVYVPLRNAYGLPDMLAEEYRDTIVSGARSEMFSQPQTSWHDPRTAAFEHGVFAHGVARAKRNQTSGSGAPLRVPFRPFV